MVCKHLKTDQGVTIDGVTQCLQKSNERPICPPNEVGNILFGDNKLIIVVRNPSLKIQTQAVV